MICTAYKWQRREFHTVIVFAAKFDPGKFHVVKIMIT